MNSSSINSQKRLLRSSELFGFILVKEDREKSYRDYMVEFVGGDKIENFENYGVDDFT